MKDNHQQPNFNSLITDGEFSQHWMNLLKDTVLLWDTPALRPHISALEKWVEERKNRPLERVGEDQTMEFLTNRRVDTTQSQQLLTLLDSEGRSSLDINAVVLLLSQPQFRFVDTTALHDLPFVTQRMQESRLLPSAADTFKSWERRDSNSVLRFIWRYPANTNCLPSLLPAEFESLNSRTLILSHWMKLGNLGNNLNCISNIEVSSCSELLRHLTDGDPTTYWQSNGSVGSHWIRLTCNANTVVSSVSLFVDFSDASYMPHNLEILGGSGRDGPDVNLKSITVPATQSGEFDIKLNNTTHYAYIQVRIVRCHSNGTDVRVRGIRVVGNASSSTEPDEEPTTPADISVLWYLQLLFALIEECSPLVPNLVRRVLDVTDATIHKLKPFALLPNEQKPDISFLSPPVLSRVEQFLLRLMEVGTEEEKLLGRKHLGNVAIVTGGIKALFSLSCHLMNKCSKFWTLQDKEEIRDTLSRILFQERGYERRLKLKASPRVEIMATNSFLCLEDGSFNLSQPKCSFILGAKDDSQYFVPTKIVIPSSKRDKKLTVMAAGIDVNGQKTEIPIKLVEATERIRHYYLSPCIVKELELDLSYEEGVTDSIKVIDGAVLGYFFKSSPTITTPTFVTPDVDALEPIFCLQVASLLLVHEHAFVPTEKANNSVLSPGDSIPIPLILNCINAAENSAVSDGCGGVLLDVLYFVDLIVSTKRVVVGKNREEQENLKLSLSQIYNSSSADQEVRKTIRKILVNGSDVFFPSFQDKESHLNLYLKAEVDSDFEIALFAGLCNWFSHEDQVLIELPPQESLQQNQIQLQQVCVDLITSFFRRLRNVDSELLPHLAEMVETQLVRIFVWAYGLAYHKTPLDESVTKDCGEVLLKIIEVWTDSLEHLLQDCPLGSRKFPWSTLSSVYQLLVALWAADSNQLLTLGCSWEKLCAVSTSLIHLLSSNHIKPFTSLVHDSLVRSRMEDFPEFVELRRWKKESTHPFHPMGRDASRLEDVFYCPGAVEFEVNFHDDCELVDSRKDRLTFRTSFGTERVVKGKVYDPSDSSARVGLGSGGPAYENWPVNITLQSRNWLQFSYRSGDGEDAEEYPPGFPHGYSFAVIARGPSYPTDFTPEHLYSTLVNFSAKFCSLIIERNNKIQTSSQNELKFWIPLVPNDETDVGLPPMAVSQLNLPEKCPITTIKFPPTIQNVVSTTFLALIRHVSMLREFIEQDLSADDIQQIQQAYKYAEEIGMQIMSKRQTISARSDGTLEDSLETEKDDMVKRCLEHANILRGLIPSETKDKDVVFKAVGGFIMSEDEDIDFKISVLKEKRDSLSKVVQLFCCFLNKDYTPQTFSLYFLTTFGSQFLDLAGQLVDEQQETSLTILFLELLRNTEGAMASENEFESSIEIMLLTYHLLSIFAIQPEKLQFKDSDGFLLRSLVTLALKKPVGVADELRVKCRENELFVSDENWDRRYKLFVDYLAIVAADENYINLLQKSATRNVVSLEEQRDILWFFALYRKRIKTETFCDGCSCKAVNKVVYRCLDCKDIDLCQRCFSNGVTPKEHGPSHKMVFLEYQCDICQGFVVGTRYHCQVCSDYDICPGCYLHDQQAATKGKSHSKDHTVTPIDGKIFYLKNAVEDSLREYTKTYSWILLRALSPFMSTHNRNKLFTLLLQELEKMLSSELETIVDDSSCYFNDMELMLGLFGRGIDTLEKGECPDWLSNLVVLLRQHGPVSSTTYPTLSLFYKAIVALGPVRSDEILNQTFSNTVSDFPNGYICVNLLFMQGETHLHFPTHDLETPTLVSRVIRKLADNPAWTAAVRHLLTQKICDEDVKLRSFALCCFTDIFQDWYPGSEVEFQNFKKEWATGIIVQSSNDQGMFTVLDNANNHYTLVPQEKIRLLNKYFPQKFHLDLPIKCVLENMEGEKDIERALKVELLQRVMIAKGGLDAIPFERFKTLIETASQRTGFSVKISKQVIHTTVSSAIGFNTKSFQKAVFSKRSDAGLVEKELAEVFVDLEKEYGIPQPLSRAIHECQPPENCSNNVDVKKKIKRLLLGPNAAPLHPLTLLQAIFFYRKENKDSSGSWRDREGCYPADEGILVKGSTDLSATLKADGRIAARPEPQRSSSTQTQTINMSQSMTEAEHFIQHHETETDEDTNFDIAMPPKKEANWNLLSGVMLLKGVESMVEQEGAEKKDLLEEWGRKIGRALSVWVSRECLAESLQSGGGDNHWRSWLKEGGDILPLVSLLWSMEGMHEEQRSRICATSVRLAKESGDHSSLFHSLYDLMLQSLPFGSILQQITGYCVQFGRKQHIATATLKPCFASSYLSNIHPSYLKIQPVPDDKSDKDEISVAVGTNLIFSVGESPTQRASVTCFNSHWKPIYISVDGIAPEDIDLCIEYEEADKATTEQVSTFALEVVGVGWGSLDALCDIVCELTESMGEELVPHLDRMFVSCVVLACELTGEQRLRLVEVLIRVIQLCEGMETPVLSLSVLLPLWKLSCDLWEEEKVNLKPPSAIVHSNLLLALTELFFLAESLALRWEVSEEYLKSLWGEIVTLRATKALANGCFVVGTLGAAINCPNKTTPGIHKPAGKEV